MNASDNKKKIEEIEAIHAEYLIEINKLRDQQNEIVSNFIKKMEEKKLESIRAFINKDK